MNQSSYVKFIAEGLSDNAFYNGVETDGKTPVSIKKGLVGKVSGALAERLLKDFPQHFKESNEADFNKQNEKKEPTLSPQKSASTPQEVEKEIQEEKGKKK